MALQFDVKPIAKQLKQCIKPSGREMALSRSTHTVDWPARAAR